MHGLSARLCSVPCRCGRGLCLSLCQRTDFVHAATPLYAGVEPTHTRICSATSCDVFARVVWIKLCGRDRLYFSALPAARPYLPRTLPATQSRMRKEFKRGTPSSFCPFRTFRTSEKYFMLHVLLHDQKYIKTQSNDFSPFL